MSQLNRHQLNQHKSYPVNQRWGSGKHPRREGCQSWPEVDPYSPTPFQFGESQTTEAPSGRRKQWVGTQTRKGDGKRERGSSLMGRGGLPCGARDARAQVLAGTGISLHWRSSTESPCTAMLIVPVPLPSQSFPGLSPTDTHLALDGLQQVSGAVQGGLTLTRLCS